MNTETLRGYNTEDEKNNELTKYEQSDFLEKYHRKVEEHWYSLYPAFFNALGEIKNKKVLDIGCGNGDFTKKFTDYGAEITGIDKSKQWIDICQQRHNDIENLNFKISDGANLKEFKDHSLDIVTLNMVLLSVETKQDIEKIFREISRVLNQSGDFLFSDVHPSCIMSERLPTRKQSYSKDFSYFKDGDAYTTEVSLVKGDSISFTNKHWTLETYTDLLKQANLYIQKIIEPTYNEEAPDILKSYKIPEYIIFHCKKLPYD